MRTLDIKLNSIDDVRKFVTRMMRCDYDVLVSEGRYIVDGKSLLGIFALNLNNPITLTVEESAFQDLESLVGEWTNY